LRENLPRDTRLRYLVHTVFVAVSTEREFIHEIAAEKATIPHALIKNIGFNALYLNL